MQYKTYDIYIPLYNGTTSEYIPGYGKSPLALTLEQSDYSTLKSAGKSFRAPIILTKVTKHTIADDADEAEEDAELEAKVEANTKGVADAKKAAEDAATKADKASKDVAGKADTSALEGLAKTSDLAGYAKTADLDKKADTSALSGLAKSSDLDAKADKSALSGLAKTSDLSAYAKTADLSGKADTSALEGLAKTEDVTALDKEFRGKITTIDGKAGTNADTIKTLQDTVTKLTADLKTAQDDIAALKTPEAPAEG